MTLGEQIKKIIEDSRGQYFREILQEEKLAVAIEKLVMEREKEERDRIYYGLQKLDWIKVLDMAIKMRPTSWGDNPVWEWRNAGDTILWSLMAIAKEQGLFYDPYSGGNTLTQVKDGKTYKWGRNGWEAVGSD